MQRGYLYASESRAFPGQLKLGKSKNLKARLSSLNTGCRPMPHKLVEVAQTLDCHRDEKLMHKYFDHARGDGEFFNVTKEEVRDFFNRVITKRFEKDLVQAGDQLIVTIDRHALDMQVKTLQAGNLKCSIGTKKRIFSALQDAERENAEMQVTTQSYQMADENTFDSMSAETRAMYGMPHIHGAYSNLCYIRSNGIDNFKTGFEYFFTANQIACNMLQMFTGSRCPFTVPRILQTNIHKSLDCTQYVEKQKVRLSQQKTHVLFTMYQQWIDLDPDSHTPLRLVEQQECLVFNQAITMLNQVLRRMYTKKFLRSGKQLRRRNEIPNHFYIMEDLHIFQESGEDLGKPVLPPWKPIVDQRMSIASLMN